MGVSRGPGYLLPVGEAFTDEYECCMVFVPAKEEYRRAFFGALDYFGTWLAWERDSAKRGQDAAAAWKLANDLTRECWEMGACTLMLEQLQAIRILLEGQHCCDGNNTITYYENTIVTTTIVPGEGSPPATWGESETPADWDDWAQYVCYHAHEFVDYLIESSGTLDDIVNIGSWGVDFLGFILSRLIYGSPGGFPVPVNFGWVSSISNSLLDALDTLEFDTMASKLEAGRDDIVCALMNGTSLEDAVESVVDNTVLWTIFYGLLDYDSTVATIYTGEVEGHGYLAPNQSAECSCDPPNPPGEFMPNYHWKVSASEWYLGGAVEWRDDAYTEDGFPIDGVIRVSDNQYPTSYTHFRSDDFAWPGGACDYKVRARSAVSGTETTQRTFVVIRLYRASDDVLMDQMSTEHTGGSGLWSEQIDNDTTVNAATDYYIKIAIDGVDGYERLIDYVSLKVHPT